MQKQLDAITEPWGVKVEQVQMKNVEIPPTMQRAMAQEAEALREKRARQIKAEAELDAAHCCARPPTSSPPAGPLELRRMQMLTEVGAEQNTMTIVMMPSEFVDARRGAGEERAEGVTAAPPLRRARQAYRFAPATHSTTSAVRCDHASGDGLMQQQSGEQQAKEG